MPERSLKSTLWNYIKKYIESVGIQIGALCGLYGLGVTLFLVLHVVIGERWTVISVLNNLAHFLTLFCVPALLLTLIIKQYRMPWSLYLLPGTLAFIIGYGGEFIPNLPVASDESAIEISVMTYNIQDSHELLFHVADDVFEADIIGLQEAPPKEIKSELPGYFKKIPKRYIHGIQLRG